MAVSYKMTDGCFTSGSNFLEFKQVVGMLSPEDVAWADSCLTRDADALDSGWNSMRDALLETLSAQHETAAHEKDDFYEGTEMEIFHDIEDRWGIHNDVKSTVSSNGAELSSGNKLSRQRTDDLWSKYSIDDGFIPSYGNSLRDLGISDLETGLVVQAFQSDQSTEDIFRIWDLGTPPEDDNFINQLNGALAECCSMQPMPSVSDHSVVSRGLNNESLGDLISGIADLSLRPNSS